MKHYGSNARHVMAESWQELHHYTVDFAECKVYFCMLGWLRLKWIMFTIPSPGLRPPSPASNHKSFPHACPAKAGSGNPDKPFRSSGVSIWEYRSCPVLETWRCCHAILDSRLRGNDGWASVRGHKADL